MKKWTVNNCDERLAAEFADKCDIGLLALKLLTARGCATYEQVVDYFRSDELEDPFVLSDMQAAVDTVNAAIDGGEKICIYGDYDCDGITATYILYTYLQSMSADVIYHINERAQGYGMNIEVVRELKEKGVGLIITVDNGISAVDEAAEAEKLGMKLVITDHHTPPDVLPVAAAIVNPHKSGCPSFYKELAGVGVALKLCAALDGGSYDMVVEQYADIAAIGTVGDLVPITGENRTLVRKGLLYLANTEKPGLLKLMELSAVDKENISSGSLAFQICPRINAAGRFASPIKALETLLTDDDESAQALAAELCELNETRKNTEQEIFKEIKDYINADPSVLNDRVLVLAGKGWHHGVIGIVSSKVLECYDKPNIIISIDEDGSARGSARSFKGFNIHDCIESASAVLEKFGGHECAGGLSVMESNIEAFRKAVREYADKQENMPAAATECDMKLTAADLTVENIRELEKLRPFGVGNPTPVFYMPGCKVNSIIPLKNGKYTKLMVSYEGGTYEALDFSNSPDMLFFREGASVDLAVNIDINQFNGRESVSIKVKDMKPAGLDPDKYLAAKDAYEKLARGITLPVNYIKKMCPSRKEMVYIYKYLQNTGEISLDDLYMRLANPVFNFCKLRLIADVFCEAGLAGLDPSTQRVKLIPATGKADLGATATMQKLEALLK